MNPVGQVPDQVPEPWAIAESMLQSIAGSLPPDLPEAVRQRVLDRSFEVLRRALENMPVIRVDIPDPMIQAIVTLDFVFRAALMSLLSEVVRLHVELILQQELRS